MRLLILSFLFPYIVAAQVLPAGATPVSGLPQGTTAQITAVTTALQGFMAYSTDERIIYYYDGTAWIPFTDDQPAAEVNPIASSIDLNGDGAVNAADIIDVDGDATVDATLQDVVEAITPITSKAGRVFYPPSIEIDASTISTTNETINLYQQYANQYDLTQNSTVINGVTVNYQTAKSTSAPNNIPIYTAAELDYYVTFADSSVFNIISLSDTGILTYRIVGTPTSDNTLINVVFVVR